MSGNAVKRYLADTIGRGQTCRESVEMVTDYFEGRLALSDRLRFQLHLCLCVGCRTYLSQMRRTIEMLARLPGERMPAAVRIELIQRFRGWKATLSLPYQETGAVS